MSKHEITKVTKTQAMFELDGFIGNLTKTIKFKREVDSNGFLSEIAADKFSHTHYRLPQGNDIEIGQYNQSLNYLSNVK